MICDIEVSKLKPDSVLYRDAKGKIICVTKEEFLKEHNDKISEIARDFANLKNDTEKFEKSITGQISSQNERIDKLSNTILEFINIMKGESE